MYYNHMSSSRTSSSTRLNILEPPVALMGPSHDTRMFDTPTFQTANEAAKPPLPPLSILTTSPPPQQQQQTAQPLVTTTSLSSYQFPSKANTIELVKPTIPQFRRLQVAQDMMCISPTPDDDQLSGTVANSDEDEEEDEMMIIDEDEEMEEEEDVKPTSRIPPSMNLPLPAVVSTQAKPLLPLKLQQKSGKVELQPASSNTGHLVTTSPTPTTTTTTSSTKKFNQGAWTTHEHDMFLQGLTACGHQWKKIATEWVKTRSRRQVASHAQKFLEREKRRSSLQSSKKETRNTNRPTLII